MSLKLPVVQGYILQLYSQLGELLEQVEIVHFSYLIVLQVKMGETIVLAQIRNPVHFVVIQV